MAFQPTRRRGCRVERSLLCGCQLFASTVIIAVVSSGSGAVSSTVPTVTSPLQESPRGWGNGSSPSDDVPSCSIVPSRYIMPSRIHRWMGPIQIQRSRSRGLWLPRGFSARGYKYPSRHSPPTDSFNQAVTLPDFLPSSSRANAVHRLQTHASNNSGKSTSSVPHFFRFSLESGRRVNGRQSKCAAGKGGERPFLAAAGVKPTGWLARSDPSGAVEATGLGSEPPWLAALFVLQPVSRRASRPLGVDFPLSFFLFRKCRRSRLEVERLPRLG